MTDEKQTWSWYVAALAAGLGEWAFMAGADFLSALRNEAVKFHRVRRMTKLMTVPPGRGNGQPPQYVPIGWTPATEGFAEENGILRAELVMWCDPASADGSRRLNGLWGERGIVPASGDDDVKRTKRDMDAAKGGEGFRILPS